MGFKKISLFSVLFILLTSCATTSSNQYLSNNYSQPVENTSITILPIKAELFFNDFPNYTFGNLKSDQEEAFNSYLPTFVKANSSSTVESIVKNDMPVNNFEVKKLKLGTDDFQIIAPRKDSILNFGDMESHFLLILDQFNFQLYSIDTGGGNYAGHEIEKASKLRFETKYLIWDNDKGVAVAWGKVNASKKYSQQVKKDVYQYLLHEIMMQIFSESPFS